MVTTIEKITQINAEHHPERIVAYSSFPVVDLEPLRFLFLAEEIVLHLNERFVDVRERFHIVKMYVVRIDFQKFMMAFRKTVGRFAIYYVDVLIERGVIVIVIPHDSCLIPSGVLFDPSEERKQLRSFRYGKVIRSGDDELVRKRKLRKISNVRHDIYAFGNGLGRQVVIDKIPDFDGNPIRIFRIACSISVATPSVFEIESVPRARSTHRPTIAYEFDDVVDQRTPDRMNHDFVSSVDDYELHRKFLYVQRILGEIVFEQIANGDERKTHVNAVSAVP